METIEVGECQVCHGRCDSRSECFLKFQNARLHEEEEKHQELLAIERAKIERYWDAVEAKIARDTKRLKQMLRLAAVAIILVCVIAGLLAYKNTLVSRSHTDSTVAPTAVHGTAPTAALLSSTPIAA